MAESIDRSDKIEHNGTIQRYLMHPNVNAKGEVLEGQSNENSLQKQASTDVPTEHLTFQAHEQLHNAIENPTTDPTRSLQPVCKANEENRAPSFREKPTANRFSALIHKRVLSGGGSTKGHHGRARSESLLFAFNKKPPNDELTLRKTHSAVHRSRLDLDKEQQANQNKDIESIQSEHLERIKQWTLSLTFDPSRLDHQLVGALEVEYATNRDFVPRGDLNNLVTQESVYDELSRMEYLPTKIIHRTWRSAAYVQIKSPPEHESARCARTGLVQGATPQPGRPCFQQVFAILLFMGRSKKIWSFVKERVSDADLPLSKFRQDGIFKLRRCGGAETPLRCLKKQSDISAFVMRQWCVLAPFFGEPDGEKVSHYKAWKGQILPFVYWGNMSRQGGSGEVHKAEVHPDHHAFDQNEASMLRPRIHKNVVAVKKLSINDRSDFDCESNVLQNLRKKQHAHPHLITLLATYEQDEHLYLILPWAEVDLNDYWKSRYPSPSSNDAELSTWLKQQCCGIAEAVSQIHRYNTLSGTSMLYNKTLSAPEVRDARNRRQSNRPLGQKNPKTLFGRHGDLKPANILWFPDQTAAKGHGTLKISDFGTARFSDDERLAAQDKTTIPNSRPYQSPEFQLPGGELSSQCDVWALGCVFLEFVCWYFGGRKLLEEFEHKRAFGYETSSFFFIKMEETSQSFYAELKQPVTEMIARLQENSVSNIDLLDILKVIQNDMLLILYDSAGSRHLQKTHCTEISASPNFLGVPQQAKRRRKSSGNIARDLGSD